MGWFEALPAIGYGVLLAWLPGAAIAFAIGAKGLNWLAYSVAGTFSSIAVASLLSPIIGIRWSALPVFIVAAVIAIVASIVKKFWISKPKLQANESWKYFGAHSILILVSFVLIGGVFLYSIPQPDFPSQTYDAIFHLNAVRHVLETGTASSFTMSLGGGGAIGGFYPSVWHAFTALIAPIAGSIVAASNVSALVIAAFVWPTTMLYLLRLLIGLQSKFEGFAAAVLIASFPAFPLLLAYFGVLYPNMLAYALLPIPLALGIRLLGYGEGDSLDAPGKVLLFLGSLAGVGLAQPNAVFALIALLLPVFLLRQIKKISTTSQIKERVKIILVTIGIFAMAMLIWLVGNVGTHWQPYQTFPEALGEFIVLGGQDLPPLLLVAALVWFGVFVIIRKGISQQYWLLMSFAVTALLFVLATGLYLGFGIRSAFVGVWYGDPFRILSLVPLTAAPLAVLGTRYLLRLNIFMKTSRSVFALTILGAILVIGTQLHPFWLSFSKTLASNYNFSQQSYLLTPDEVQAFQYIETNVSKDVAVIGSPWNGSSLIYAYTAHEPLFYVPRAEYHPDFLRLAEGIISGGATACNVAAEFQVGYVLDFGDEYILRDQYLVGQEHYTLPFKNLVNIGDSESVVLVEQFGEVKIFKITGCN